MISHAETAAEDELPDIPLWDGTTFSGSTVDESTVCVDRTYRDGGGVGGKGGSAGYVLVTFPGETVGEPQDGVCSDASGAPKSRESDPVAVPDSAKEDPGLVTRTDLGSEWPLAVDYGIVTCKDETGNAKSAIFTAPNGTKYALNGTAKSFTDGADINPIWADDPDVEGLKIPIGALIKHALTLC